MVTWLCANIVRILVDMFFAPSSFVCEMSDYHHEILETRHDMPPSIRVRARQD
jgi:hypothetical protein